MDPVGCSLSPCHKHLAKVSAAPGKGDWEGMTHEGAVHVKGGREGEELDKGNCGAEREVGGERGAGKMICGELCV